MIFDNNNIADIKLEIGKLIRKMRNSAKISQEELANKLALSRITIQNIETGKNFNIDTMLLIFQYFDETNSFSEFIRSKNEGYDNLTSFY